MPNAGDNYAENSAGFTFRRQEPATAAATQPATARHGQMGCKPSSGDPNR